MDVLHFPLGNQRGLFDQFGKKGASYCGERQDYNGNCRTISLIAPGTDIKKVETAVQQLRIAVSDCKLNDNSDEHLIKWLSMQDFNVVRTEKMLRQSLEWRRLNRADEILDTYTPSEVFIKYYSFAQFGIDKYGCPVFASAAARMDIKGIALSSTKKEFLDYLIWMEEKFVRAAKEVSERTGKQVTTFTIIIDFEQLSMRHLTCKIAVQKLLETANLKSNHYPMNIRRAFVINAPKMCFQLMLTMLKPFMPECSLMPIRVFGSDRNEWTSALLEEIDADQFPAYYGGTLTDPDGDPKCPSKFNMGGEVPQSYYLKKDTPVAKDYMETLVIIAGAGGRKKLKYKVDVPCSVLRWEFMTEGGDIQFRVYTKNFKGCTFDLVPLCRVDSHLAMEEGQITCDEPGKYVFEFDNTFSYLRTKKLRYHICVV